MANMKKYRKRIIILVPYPAQGHVTPMHKLALAFLDHGFQPIIVLPQFLHHQISLHHHHHPHPNNDGIKWVSLRDGLEDKKGSDDHHHRNFVPDFFAIEAAMEGNNVMGTDLEGLIHEVEEEEGGDGVVCVVVDLLASWAIEVGERCGIPTAGFWPALLATYRLLASIPQMVHSGFISDDTGLPQHDGKICLLPDLPILETEDLPWLIGTTAAKKARFKFWTRTLERSKNLRWLLVNSFQDESNNNNNIYKCNSIITTSSQDFPNVYPIVPQCRHIGISSNTSFWEEDLSCLEWLEKQEANSVVYISFGSWVSPIGEAKLTSLALALEASRRPFIWVLKSSWCEGLPNGFLERISMNQAGKVVSWAPQMAILNHKSVGCYLTHCGWNSTMEAIRSQKRMLCYPVAGDQFLNCAYIVQVWRVGIRLNGLGQKDVEEGLSWVMEKENNVEMEIRLRELYENVMGERDDEDDLPRGVLNLKNFIENIKNVAYVYN
ncbi:UDP-glycosyltransferase 82A1 [Senna tora]|uniref:Glycosyltransferase n=1 Tax=Senna tora TaxID=362788 RepID=A0A834T3U8_9FABA|nr:UDP-glycosyltransferase 82A1 [Senna tora]